MTKVHSFLSIDDKYSRISKVYSLNLYTFKLPSTSLNFNSQLMQESETRFRKFCSVGERLLIAAPHLMRYLDFLSGDPVNMEHSNLDKIYYIDSAVIGYSGIHKVFHGFGILVHLIEEFEIVLQPNLQIALLAVY